MATQSLARVWTYEEFAALPDDGNRYEVIAGELYMTPAPGTPHSRVAFELGFQIELFLRTHGLGGWVVTSPVDVLLAEGDYLEPDLVYVRRERKGIIKQRGIEAAPDLVVEVISPSTADRDRGIKRERYAYFGVPHYWVVDLDARQIEVYRMLVDPLRPEIVKDMLEWQPIPGGPVLKIDVQQTLQSALESSSS
ncbi:MAG TPA: Uma2 family endonuclease [Longimicrobium sp.]|jgi:Uma2 family endonuclease